MYSQIILIDEWHSLSSNNYLYIHFHFPGWSRGDKKPIVYVTQPEGTYHKINLEDTEYIDAHTAVVTCNVLEDHMGTPDLSPEIVTKLKDRKGDERSVGFISSDGIVALLEDDQISWVKKVILNIFNFT